MAELVESTSLLTRQARQTASRVRIPPSPQTKLLCNFGKERSNLLLADYVGIRTAEPKIFSRKFCEPVPSLKFFDEKILRRRRIPPSPQEKFNEVKFRRKPCYGFRGDSKTCDSFL